MPTPRSVKYYGWKPSLKNPFDPKVTIVESLSLPEEVSLRSGFTPPYDQGELGSCTANAIAAAIDYERIKQGLEPINPSRLFIYFNERSIEGDIGQDNGAQIRDGIMTASQQGACPEAEWPYDISQFAARPHDACFVSAQQHRVLKYALVVQTIYGLRYQLAHGLPVIFGFTVFESFESDTVAKTGMVPMPQPNEQVLGGHAVVAVGYKFVSGKLLFEVRKSWGTDWGDAGYFWMPGEYLGDKDLASDMWEIRLAA